MEEIFEWEISGDNLTVSALGIEVSGVSLPAKKVILKGFNNLKDGVKVQTFDLPANDPAGGIHLTIEATATNVRFPSTVLSAFLVLNMYNSPLKLVSSSRRLASTRMPTISSLPPFKVPVPFF